MPTTVCARTLFRAHAHSCRLAKVTKRDPKIDAWAALLHVHAALVPQLDRELRQATGLPLAWYDILLELNAAPDGSLTMSALSQRVVLSRTRVSRLVPELVGQGLVERHAHEVDRRSSYATITPAGKQVLRDAAPTYLSGISKHFGHHLSAAEARTIAASLRRVSDHLGASRRRPGDVADPPE